MTDASTADTATGIGHRLAPPRFIAFVVVLLLAVPAGIALLGLRMGAMAGFDLAAIIFLGSIAPLLNDETASMRQAAQRNDANRAVLLGITGIVSIAILAAVAAELAQKGAPKLLEVVAIIVTLVLAWLFSNVIYALHYAHMFYVPNDDGKDHGGLNFPDEDEPDYWDFIYFSFTLGMTFQTSDVEISGRGIRRVVIFHCLAAFVFNLGVLAFSVNVLGGG